MKKRIAIAIVIIAVVAVSLRFESARQKALTGARLAGSLFVTMASEMVDRINTPE